MKKIELRKLKTNEEIIKFILNNKEELEKELISPGTYLNAIELTPEEANKYKSTYIYIYEFSKKNIDKCDEKSKIRLNNLSQLVGAKAAEKKQNTEDEEDE
jgi:hypothetical protein